MPWYRTTYLDLTPRACLVGTPLASQSSHLGTRLPLLLAGPFQRLFCFLHLSSHFRSFFSFFSSLVSCACVYSEHGIVVGEPGAVAGVSGCWQVEKRLQAARSPLSCLGVACASRHEGMHERALSGLHL